MRRPSGPSRERAISSDLSRRRESGLPSMQTLQAERSVHDAAARSENRGCLSADREIGRSSQSGTIGETGRTEHVSLPPFVQGGNGHNAETVRNSTPRKTCKKQAEQEQHRDRSHLRCRLQLEWPLLRRVQQNAWHDPFELSLG